MSEDGNEKREEREGSRVPGWAACDTGKTWCGREQRANKGGRKREPVKQDVAVRLVSFI